MGKEEEGVHGVTSGVFRNFSTVFLLITEYYFIYHVSQKYHLLSSLKCHTSPPPNPWWGGGGGEGVQGRVRGEDV